MKLTAGLATLTRVAMPSIAAAGLNHGNQKQDMSCAGNSVYDNALHI